MSTRRLILVAVAVAAVQIGFLVSMIAGRAAILRSGQEVTLQVLPIDPRDLLRGDYVVLGYDISSIPVELFADSLAGNAPRPGSTVFVRLAEGEGGLWRPIAARYGERPEPATGEGEVDIRGTAGPRWNSSAQSVSVTYGIERFYVPEGEGREIEAGIRERDFRMRVAVGRDGTAQIKSFHDGDTMLYAEPFY